MIRFIYHFRRRNMDIAFNNGWLFTEDFEKGFDGAQEVRLPHTMNSEKEK